MGRYGDDTVLLGLLATGEVVTIQIWYAATGIEFVMSPLQDACNEIGTTGIFIWKTLANLQPSIYTEYIYRMKNASGVLWCTGKFALKAPEAYTPTKEEIREEIDTNSVVLNDIKKRVDDLEVLLLEQK